MTRSQLKSKDGNLPSPQQKLAELRACEGFFGTCADRTASLLSVTSRPWQGLNELNLISQDLDNLCRCGYVRVSVSPPKKFRRRFCMRARTSCTGSWI